MVFVTGANGGIGSEICACFRQKGWRVIGSDIQPDSEFELDGYVSMDLARLVNESDYKEERVGLLRESLAGRCDCLVNNAAHQLVKPATSVTADELAQSLGVNVSAPFLLVKSVLDLLEESSGSVINVGSVHATLTKPGFLAYSVSKSALEGLTRALAVELGSSIRFCGVSPAAVSSSMLVEGFANDPGGLKQLADYHPTKSIGQPDEVARLVCFLAEEEGRFLNGSIIALDGGISSRLHDPV